MFKKLIGNLFIINIFKLISASAFGQLILLLILPIITILYAPSEFGVLAVCLGVVNVISVVSGGRYEVAIPLPHSKEDSLRLVRFALRSNIVFSFFTLLGITILYSMFFDDNQKSIYNALWLAPIGVFSIGCYRIFSFLAIRNGNYNVISKTKLSQSTINAFMQVIFGFLHFGATALFLAQIMGQSFGVKKLSENFSFKSILDIKYKTRDFVVLKKYSKFPKYDAPAALVDTFSSQLPNLFLAFAFSPAYAGLYMLSERLLVTPMSIISQAIAQVYYNRVVKNLNNGLLTKDLFVILFSLVTLAIVFSVIFYFGIELLVTSIFESQWFDVINVVRYLVFGVAVQLVFSPVSMLLMATNGQKISLIIHSVLLSVKILFLYLGFINDSFYLFVVGVSLGNFVVYFFAILLIVKRTMSKRF